MPEQLFIELWQEIVEALERVLKASSGAQLQAERNVQPKESTAASDAQGASNEHNMGLDRSYLYRRGRVVDSFAYLNFY